MKHATYVGEDRELRHRGAAVVEAEDDGHILAQFDDRELRGADGSWLGFCWTRFPRADFRFDPTMDDARAAFDLRRPVAYAREAIARAVEFERPAREAGHGHRHFDVGFVYDLRADRVGGPRTYHAAGWACACGRVEYADDGAATTRTVHVTTFNT
jgi:hypothetical protein